MLHPKLRFPEFKENWNKKKLKDIAEVNPTNTKLPQTFIYIDLESVDTGVLKKENLISRENAPSRAQRLLKENDILFQTVRPYQMNNLFFNKTGDYVASTGYAQIRACQNSKFLYQYLHFKKFVDLVLEKCTGTSYPSINTSDLTKTIISIPSLPEQEKIASFLSTVDEKINLLKKQLSLLEQYKKGVMQKIFSREIRFKDEDGKEFPEWEERRLNEVVKIYDGTHQTPIYVDEGIPFYSVEHVTSNQFTKTKYISREVFEKENKRVKLERGDILMTRIGSIGVAKLINWEVEGSFYVSLALLKNNNAISNEYLAHFIHSRFFQNELWKRTIHVAFPQKINLGEIGECIVKLPSLSEQQKIASFLSTIDEKIDYKKDQIRKMESWKKGLLQQMLI
jgi:type I restriction enzyme S subunit